MSPTDLTEATRQRLNGGYIRQTADLVRAALADGDSIAVEYQPGDGTRYPLVFVPLATIATPDDRAVVFSGADPMEDTLVCLLWPNSGSAAYTIDLRDGAGFASPDYVAEKWLGRGFDASAIALAELLNLIRGASW